jgi:hypothetical protein
MTSAERLKLWNAVLFPTLLPLQEQAGTPVLLGCDDETIRAAADRLGFECADPSMQFGRDVGVAFQVGKNSGWRRVVAGNWEKAPRPRPLPPFFPVLCLWVLAATRMAPDDKHPTMEYHGRLCELVGVAGDDSLECFNFIGSRFRGLADWLENDMQGRRGHLLVPSDPHPAHVGYAVQQTVFRLRDRQVLSVFFMDRLRGSLNGFDPLRRLQRWSGRGQLTGHAQRIIDDPKFEDRVRAAIRVAFQSWDGAELVETAGGGVGRLWPANVRLRVYPEPHLNFGAANLKTVSLTIANEQLALEPGRELPMPWDLLVRAAARPVDLGDARTVEGGIRLPRLGATIVFENGEEGLLRVESPSSETVWVLSNDGLLQERLQRRKFNDGGTLPVGWELFYEVPVADVPGVDRAPLAMAQQTPLQIQGGLSLGHPRYLSGHAPSLVAADLETESHLRVIVNGELHGHISSGGQIALPLEPGRYDVDVGDGFYKTSYDVEEHGDPAGERLSHHLGSERALRVGATPATSDIGNHDVVVCGATVLPAYAGALPFLTRVRCDAQTIRADGTLVNHQRPPTPAWFKEVGLDDSGRWELFCDNPVWLLTPPAGGRARVRLLRDTHLTDLDIDAARRVTDLGSAVDVQRGAVATMVARERWIATLALAHSILEKGVPA